MPWARFYAGSVGTSSSAWDGGIFTTPDFLNRHAPSGLNRISPDVDREAVEVNNGHVIDLNGLVFEDCAMPLVRRRPPRERASTFLCASCGERFPARSPTAYCSPRCRGAAKAVRYGRRKLAQYGVLRVSELPDNDERAALYTKLTAAFLGYDERSRRLTTSERRVVYDRDGGRCRKCGEPGEEIDHVAGSSRDPGNLRLLCRPCHDAISLPRLLPGPRGGKGKSHNDALKVRMEAPSPLRPCDMAHWEQVWREWVMQHAGSS